MNSLPKIRNIFYCYYNQRVNEGYTFVIKHHPLPLSYVQSLINNHIESRFLLELEADVVSYNSKWKTQPEC